MKAGRVIALAGLAALAVTPAIESQTVYRCERSDGSIVFSDRPCAGDSGRQQLVDATPHQGHRPATTPARRESATADRSRDAASPSESKEIAAGGRRKLPRFERLSLERERGELLSGLKRRHLAAEERRSLLRELRRVDRRLGIGPEDVGDMPFHNREVYEDYPVFPERRED